ncbi:hypothetical protein B7J55_004878 [Salmonella enterica subsp. enterica serovar Indiana]|nr:hypothetical protein [Salmonella enterica subsp. enterica serovar Indiana]EEE1035189.1 hypothetical protein [Salmonella enterica subsp. enterica serovar Indiana]
MSRWNILARGRHNSDSEIHNVRVREIICIRGRLRERAKSYAKALANDILR